MKAKEIGERYYHYLADFLTGQYNYRWMTDNVVIGHYGKLRTIIELIKKCIDKGRYSGYDELHYLTILKDIAEGMLKIINRQIHRRGLRI